MSSSDLAPSTPETFVRLIPATRGTAFPDESTWSETPAFELRRAQDGLPPKYKTQVRLLDDGRNLFVRFDCEDVDIWATHKRRDAPLWEEEVVEVFLSPGDSIPVRYVEIEVNPLGAIFDARVTNPDGRRDTMRVDASWDAAGLVAKVSRPGARHWRVELALTWSEACDDEPPLVWRANFFRIERPRGLEAEFSCWSPTLADPPDFHRPSHFGRLVRAHGPNETGLASMGARLIE